MLDRLCGRSIYSALLLLAGVDPQHFAHHTGAQARLGGARSPPSEGRTHALVIRCEFMRKRWGVGQTVIHGEILASDLLAIL